MLNASGKCFIEDCRLEFKLCYKSCLSLMHFFHAFQIPHFEVRSDQSVWVLRRERELWLVAEYMSFVLFQIITLCLMQSCYAELWAVQAEVYQESCNQKYFRFPPRNSGSCRVERGQSAWKQGTGAGTLNPAPASKTASKIIVLLILKQKCARWKHFWYFILYLAN